MNNRKLNKFFSGTVIVLFCIPTSNIIFSSVYFMIEILQYIGFGWAIVLFIKLKIFKKREYWPIWFFLLVNIASTFFNRTSLTSCIGLVLPIFTICVVIHHWIKLTEFKGIEEIALFFVFLFMIQFISVIVGGFGSFYDGNGLLNINYFFASRVNFNRVFIYVVSIFSLCLFYGKKKKWLYFLGIILGVYFMYSQAVSTGIMTFLVFVFVFIISIVIKSEKLWRNLIILAFVVATLFVVLGRVDNLFEWLLVDFLKENMTLNGRTLLWEQAISMIDGWHWLLGYGYGHSYLFRIDLWKVGTAHSQYMNILFCNGIIGLIAYSIIICGYIKNIFKNNELVFKSIIIATAVAMIIMGIPTTTYTAVYLYITYIVFCCIVKNDLLMQSGTGKVE